MASGTLVHRTPSALLRLATRLSTIKGMEGEPIPDPIAQDVLRAPGIDSLDCAIKELGIAVVGVIGAGASSIVLDAGDVVLRLGCGPSTAVPLADGVLQPINRGEIGSIRFEIMPKADISGITEEDLDELDRQLESQGLLFSDRGVDNVGRVNGQLVVIDPGAVTTRRNPGLLP